MPKEQQGAYSYQEWAEWIILKHSNIGLISIYHWPVVEKGLDKLK